MGFDAATRAALEAPLVGAKVKTRQQSGRSLSYIEGWWAISEANRIFGFDGWTRETIDLRCVAEHERPIGQQGAKGWGVTYIARVRIMVGDITREGSGTGHGIDRDQGQAHESALKEAETDAMKRALMTFGNPFGLALYDKEQNGVSHDDASASTSSKPSAAAPTQSQAIHTPMQLSDDDREQAKNWCADQKALLDASLRLPNLTDWLDAVGGRRDRDENGKAIVVSGSGDWAKPFSGSGLARLKSKFPEAFNDLKSHYMERMKDI